MYDNIYNNPKRKGKSTSNHSGNWNSIYSIMSLYASSNNFSLSDMSYLAVSDSLIQSVALMHFYSKKYAYNQYMNVHNSDQNVIYQSFGQFGMVYSDQTRMKNKFNPGKVDIVVRNFVERDESLQIYRSRVVENLDLNVSGQWVVLMPLIPQNISEYAHMSLMMKKATNIFFSKCVAATINFSCTSHGFQRYISSINNNPMGKKVMLGQDFKSKKDYNIGRIGRDRSAFLT